MLYDGIRMIPSSDAINQIGKTLGRAARARKVLLFGSYATGHASEQSDVDYFIIADSELPRHKRSRQLYALFHPYPFPMDILVYTPDEVERQLKDPSSFVASVIRQGKEVYVG